MCIGLRGALAQLKSPNADSDGMLPGQADPSAQIRRLFSEYQTKPQPRDRSLGLAIAVPAGAALVWVLHHSERFRYLQQMTVGMILHELGHAVASWLGGILAIPLPLLTLSGGGRSSFGFALGVSLVAFMFWKGWRAGQPAWMVFASIATVAMVLIARFSDDERSDLIAASGIGGEFVLGALFIAGAFYRLSSKASWNTQRYVLLTFGLLVLVPAWLRWVDIGRGLAPLPLGSAIGGEDVGDMNTLLDVGYSDRTIIDGYLDVGRWCLVFVVANWVVLVGRVLRVRQDETS
jgi:hypothetical protein